MSDVWNECCCIWQANEEIQFSSCTRACIIIIITAKSSSFRLNNQTSTFSELVLQHHTTHPWGLYSLGLQSFQKKPPNNKKNPTFFLYKGDERFPASSRNRGTLCNTSIFSCWARPWALHPPWPRAPTSDTQEIGNTLQFLYICSWAAIRYQRL